MTGNPTVQTPRTAVEASRILADLGSEGAALAGGTWIMRANLRGESPLAHYVSLGKVDGVHDWHVDVAARIGALTTHRELASLDHSPVNALSSAAGLSAFPAVRAMATVGGNICASPFPEADLLPALLVCEADLTVVSTDGEQRLPLAGYLPSRAERPAGEVLTHVHLPLPARRRSAFERLTVRGGGEYALASIAVSVDLVDDEVVGARIAIGSVEPLARLLPGAAAALVGCRLSAGSIDEAGAVAEAECVAREGHDAPAWYRSVVLPALLARACESLRESAMA